MIRGCVGYTLSIMPEFRTDPHFQLAVLKLSVEFHIYGGLCFGSYILVWNEDSHWFFIPWPFAMWSPFGSRVCSFSVIAKDWQFLLEFHLRLMVIGQFFGRVGTGHVFLCSMFRHPSVGCITC